ncbi:MAG: VWA domain-containing protein [Methanothrix sp.]|nr:VWA domain-containing protein [Methanothrix sp.]
MILVLFWTGGALGSAVTADQHLSRNAISPSEICTVSISLMGGEVPCASPIDVVLSIDSSGSMTTSDPGDLRKSAAREFVAGLDLSMDRVGIVSWNTSAVSSPLTSNLEDIESSINSIGADGNTSLDTGLEAAIDLLPESSRSKVIVLLTDGVSTDGGHYTPPGVPGSPVDEARSKGIVVFTIGLGPEADARNLTEIAHSTGGEFYSTPDASALASIYQRIRSSITGIVAKDVTVTYVLPASLNVNLSPGSQPVASMRRQGDSTVLTWQIGILQANQSRTLSFDVSSPDPGAFILGMAPDTAVSYTECDGTRSTVAIPPATLRVSPPGSFSLEGSGIGGSNESVVQNTSVLSVSKEVLPNGNGPCPDCPRLRVALETPERPCNADILFVMDKSGSMRDRDNSGRKNFEVMQDALYEMLQTASSTPGLRNARIAIVSWDDWNPTDSADRDTTLDPQWLAIGDQRIMATIQRYNEDTCRETDLTFYEAGLQKAMRIMHSRIISQANDPLSCDTRRFIIFITCRSEFRGISQPSVLYTIPGNSTLIRGGFEGILPFYIGTDLNEFPLEEQNLTEIAQLGDPLQRGISAPQSLTAGNLISTILKRMNGCAQGPWVTNVTLTETLYPYLKYTGADPLPDAVTYNRDGSTTLTWNIGTLNSGERWSATIDASVQLKLPVDVTERRTEFVGNISSSTPYSRVDFDWPALSCAAPLRRHYELPLAEGRMWITCGAPCKTPEMSEQTAQQNRKASETPETPTSSRAQPGFEGLLGVLSLMAGYLCIRRF